MRTNKFIKISLIGLIVFGLVVGVNSISQASPTQSYPNALELGSFFGGSGDQVITNLHLDNEGNIIVVGRTTAAFLPSCPKSYDPSWNGGTDVFIAKFSQDGHSILYCSYLGGSGTEWSSAGTSVLDAEGNVYIIGQTNSGNFPTTDGAFDRHYEPSFFGDMFISKLDFEGNLLSSTFLGGTGDEEGIAIGLDRSNYVYVTGWSRSSNFPGIDKPNMYDPSLNGGYDVVVAKLTPDLSDVIYGTYIGSSGLEVPQTEAFYVDDDGNVYIGGSVLNSGFPTTPDAFDPTWNGTNTSQHGDGFVLKLKNDFTELLFSSYIGGSGGDRLYGLYVDDQKNVYVSGHTSSLNFPDTFGGTYSGGGKDGFLTKISPDGSTILFSRYIGGAGDDVSALVRTGESGEIYLSTYTFSNNLFVTGDAYSSSNSGGRDGYLTIFTPDGDQILYATYIGGSGDESVGLRTVDSEGNFYFTANTYSTDFPTTTGAYDQTYNGGYDGAFLKLYIPNRPPIADAGGPYTLNEGETLILDAYGSSDPDLDELVYEWDLDDDGEYDDASGITTAETYQNNGEFVIGLQVSDSYGDIDTDDASVSVNNVCPSIEEIFATMDPVQTGTEINVSASFFDPGALDTHVATWDWGDENSSTGNIDGHNVSGSHVYDIPGIYSILLSVEDNDDCADNASFLYKVVYDPEGGFVTGGGWIWSPEGAYTPDPSLTGKASFGLVSKYKKGANVPTGNTEFQFQAGDLNFKSTSYDWLVIAGKKAMFKGVGEINGQGEYGFMLTAVDGDLHGGDGIDKFRIKIWDLATEAIIYDNQLGQLDDAEPQTELGGGSIVIHQEK